MANELCKEILYYDLEKGKLINTIPAILAKGRFPIWAARLHQERASRAGQNPEWNSWSYTPGELSVYPIREGDVLHAITCYKGGLTEAGKLLLPQFKPDAPIVANEYAIDGSLIYEQLEAMTPEQGVIRVTQADIQKYAGKDMPKDEVFDNKLVRILFRQGSEVPEIFREDDEVLKTAIETSFAPGYNIAMGVYFASPNATVPKVMAWGVNGLGSWSRASASCSVYGDYGRLFSVAPEALDAKNSGYIDARRYTDKEAGEYLEGLKVIRETFGAESPVIKKLGSLEGKI
jgi:hypothetical protein